VLCFVAGPSSIALLSSDVMDYLFSNLVSADVKKEKEEYYNVVGII